MTGNLLSDLTPAQRQAVEHVHGPMLVVAGAGSGKTRVVTRRIANLIASGVKPWRILALTFTNKAAREMRDRVESLVGTAPAWMGTFHSVCARFLRMDIHLIDAGRDNRFSIMDSADQEGLVKQALKRLDLNDKSNRPSNILAAISNAKSALIGPDEYTPSSWRDEIVAKVYSDYERELRRNNAADFDDLLLLAVRLLENAPGALERYRMRFPFILVDEYQDTNRVQYLLLKKLAGDRANIHATGDPDQSIYSWRGADYQNIMDFQKDFPGAAVVRLEQNYRSSGNILAAANKLIRHNRHRIDKDLVTDNPPGDKILYAALQSDAMEAAWIAEEISKLKRDGNPFNHAAVFYRTNAQSRPIEEAFMRAGIPYQLVGGVRFYERKEVKDLLAHLKVLVNPRDLPSMRRIVKCRSTGVGDKTLDKIAEMAEAAEQPVFAYLASPDFEQRFKPNKKTQAFAKWCARLAAIDISRADAAVKEVLQQSGLIEELLANTDKDEAAENRLDNLHSLTARAADFVKLRSGIDPQAAAEDEENPAPPAFDLAAFLEDVALVADIDNMDDNAEKTTLMTLHSAKGLEFPFVFVSGLEEGLLPHRNCLNEKALEEERRLFYVGLTRAEKRAWISRSEWRYTYGSSDYAEPSRFLEELPFAVVEKEDYSDPVSTEFGAGFLPGSGKKKAAAEQDEWLDDPFSDDLEVDSPFDFEDVDVMDPPVESIALKKGSLNRKNTIGISNTKARNSAVAPFLAGDLVRHPGYGSGKVLTVDKKKILVQFFASGTRLLLLDLCQLTKE